MTWWMLAGRHLDEIGFLPEYLDEYDPRSAQEQFDANYPFGGGWQSKPHRVDADGVLYYPGDPPLKPIGGTQLRDEMILVYPAAFVAIVQPDGTFVVQRMD